MLTCVCWINTFPSLFPTGRGRLVVMIMCKGCAGTLCSASRCIYLLFTVYNNLGVPLNCSRCREFTFALFPDHSSDGDGPHGYDIIIILLIVIIIIIVIINVVFMAFPEALPSDWHGGAVHAQMYQTRGLSKPRLSGQRIYPGLPHTHTLTHRIQHVQTRSQPPNGKPKLCEKLYLGIPRYLSAHGLTLAS